jgi:tetratricopeptide (TPR) repeat protein
MVESGTPSPGSGAPVSPTPNPGDVPTDIKQFHRLAIQAHREGDTRRAVELLRRAVVEGPEGFRATVDFHTLSRRLGDASTVDGWSSRVLVLLPTHAPALRDRGREFLDRRDWRRASRVWRQALICDPRQGNDWASLARAAASSQVLEDCLRYFGWASRIEPSNIPLRFARASALFNARRLGEAETLMRSVYESGRDDPKVLFWMGRILHAQGKRDEANPFLAAAAKTSTEMARWTQMIQATVLASDFVPAPPS